MSLLGGGAINLGPENLLIYLNGIVTIITWELYCKRQMFPPAIKRHSMDFVHCLIGYQWEIPKV